MKKMSAIILLVMVMVFNTCAGMAEKTQITLSENGISDKAEIELGTLDERAVMLTEGAKFVENEEGTDSGLIQYYWNPEVYAMYGCTMATLNYENPIASNMGVIVSIVVYDNELLEKFGTTFRSEEECTELALKGLSVLKNGVYDSNTAADLFFKGYIPSDYITVNVDLPSEELVKRLADAGFLKMTEEELLSLNEEKVLELSELEKLQLAELGGYSFDKYYHVIAETGVINPGYAVYNTPLYTFEDGIALPKGTYNGDFFVQAYDKNSNKISDMAMNFFAIINVQEDLPEGFCQEYGITLAAKSE